MKRITLTILILVFSIPSHACIMSPSKRTAMDSDRMLQEYDVMFFGRLDSEEVVQDERRQVAKFTVIKSYKGKISGKVVINNKLNTSCSSVFQVPRSAFYVFAKFTETEGIYEISGFASFIPLGNAMEYEWSPE
ncbi:hypothetical protein MO867_15965 [Microbulbifer sp. OS29]|uniref:Tissue inhibitor of metalloproteinase n=1 Tax=Microbulbifer okhotskensis TaxID=2926617 RepID=A0A9X2EQ73_9GAMM|nr:hypothetical protein [Microbulbifer okhotskensis]MCO1335831.1 hypothetical protein [Microbulbifer okhotskensis]